MKKTKFAFSNAVTADDIKCIRKKLSLTQASFAQLVNVSTKTVERWEAESKPITGPIVSLVKILNEDSQIVKEYEIPEKIMAPVAENEIVGSVKVHINTEIIEQKEEPPKEMLPPCPSSI